MYDRVLRDLVKIFGFIFGNVGLGLYDFNVLLRFKIKVGMYSVFILFILLGIY